MQKKEVLTWAWIIIIAIVILGCFYFINRGDEEGYKEGCVDWCVSDIGDCAGLSYIVDEDGETWLYGWDFEACFGELESCVKDCER